MERLVNKSGVEIEIEKERVIDVVEVEEVLVTDEIVELMSKLTMDYERLARYRALLNVLKKSMLAEGCSPRDEVLLGRMLYEGVPHSIEDLTRLEDEVDKAWFGK